MPVFYVAVSVKQARESEVQQLARFWATMPSPAATVRHSLTQAGEVLLDWIQVHGVPYGMAVVLTTHDRLPGAGSPWEELTLDDVVEIVKGANGSGKPHPRRHGYKHPQ